MPEEKRKINAREFDLSAVERLCTDTWEAVYRYIYYRVQNREEAEDITQETYARAISFMQKQNARMDNKISFLKKVSLNILRDRWRKAKGRPSEVNMDELNPGEVSTDDFSLSSTERQVITDALNELNEAQRMVVELRIIRGYSVTETARIMNKTEGAVRTLQYRAIKNLSEILKNNE